MKKVTIDDRAAKHLVGFYQGELKEALKKVDEIKSKLRDLDVDVADLEEKGKKGRKKSIEAVAKKSKNLRLPWEDFVIGAVRSANKPITTSELSDMAVEEYELSGPNVSKGRSSINRYVGAMCKEGKLKAYMPEGSRAYLYGFPEWFDGEDLKAEWKEKATDLV
jgi:hypothetical protein